MSTCRQEWCIHMDIFQGFDWSMILYGYGYEFCFFDFRGFHLGGGGGLAGKWESVGMPKDFDFQMSVIYVMSSELVRSQAQQQQLLIWINYIATKLT